MRTRRGEFQAAGNHLPSVSIVVSMYNEERYVEEKIQNIRELNYPAEKMHVLFGSDGSTDRTNEILRHYESERCSVHIFDSRRGKAAVLNDLIPLAVGDIVVLSDVNTLYNSDTILELVRPFQDERVGAVCGELIFRSQPMSNGIFGEITYWNYENTIKRLESTVHSTLGATGAVYAIRKHLFSKLPTDKVVMDDFLIPIAIARQGYTVKYQPKAVAHEAATASVRDEFRRKVRIGAANFHGITEFASLLHPKHGFLAFSLWSHKILRWCVPFFLMAMLFSSIVLSQDSEVFRVILMAEVVFILLALLGYLAEKLKFNIGPLSLPYYFLAMNLALFVGFFKFLFGKQRPMWDIVR